MDLLKTSLLDSNPLEVQGTTFETFPLAPLLVVPQVITPSLELNFATGKQLDSRITFVRSSSGTFINSSGLVETATTNVARFTHDPVTLASLGLLIEESRTNVLVRSQEFNDASWTKNAITATGSSGTSPDGTNNAISLVPTTASAGHNILQFVSKAASAITYTVSTFAKANGYNFVGFRIDDGGANGAYACYNVSTGAVSTSASTSGTGFSNVSASVISYKSGWYKLILTLTTNSGTTIRPVITVQDATGNPFTYSFSGNGTSGVLMWGAQIEAGAFATSYIPTTSATVIRAADVATMSSTNFSNWYNQSEGTFVISGLAPVLGTGTNSRLLSVGPSPASIDIVIQSSGVASIDQTTVSTLIATSNSTSSGASIKVAAVLKPGAYSIVMNGGTVASDIDSNSITATSLTVGSTAAGQAYVNSTISRIRYYRRGLSSETIKSLTT